MSKRSDSRKIIFFGTGTSHGVPVMTCKCKVCTSSDPRDRRFRSSLLYEQNGKKIIIDCGPDFRSQYLAYGRNGLDAALLTHIHYDHVGGLDDLRPFSYAHGFDVFASADVIDQLRRKSPYYFTGSAAKGLPNLRFHAVMPYMPFETRDIKITPLGILHGKMPILGYKIGDFAYITDASTVPEETIDLLRGIRYLVVNALRPHSHPSHMNLQQALDVIKETGASQAFLTHMSHDMGLHQDLQAKLPDNVRAAYDGLTVKLE